MDVACDLPKGVVTIKFDAPVTVVQFYPGDARRLAKTLVREAEIVEKPKLQSRPAPERKSLLDLLDRHAFALRDAGEDQLAQTVTKFLAEFRVTRGIDRQPA